MAQPPGAALAPTRQAQILFSETPQDFGTVPKRGEWNNIGEVGVLRTATSIPGNADQARAAFGAARTAETESLPDVWSQIEGFADALFQANHERHLAAERIWRGLLACLALAADTLPNLHIRKIDLRAPTPFVRTASKLPLRLPFLSYRYDARTNAPVALDEVGIMHLQEERPPLALLNPITLVAPARSLREALGLIGLDDRAAWLTTDRIEDPTEYQPALHRLSRPQYEVLAAYLQRLLTFVAGSRAVTNQGGQNVPPTEGVIERLDADDSLAPKLAKDRARELGTLLANYWKDARTGAQRRGQQTGNQNATYQVERATRAVTPFADTSLYGPERLQAFRVARSNRPDDVQSHTQIDVRRDANGLFRGVVLADPQFALGDPQHVLVLDTTTVMDLRDQPDKARRMQHDAMPRNILVVTADDLFTDRLVQIPNGTVPGHLRRGLPDASEPLENYVLPLTPLALLLLDSLAGDHPRLRLVRQGDEEIQAILTIPLAPLNGDTARTHDVKKTFRTSGGRGAIGQFMNAVQVETLALWPNLPASDWHAFHIYSGVRVDSIARDPTLLPIWPIQAQALAALATAPDGSPQTAAARARSLLASWTQIRAGDQALPLTKQIVMNQVGEAAPGGAVEDRRLLQIPARPEAYLMAAPLPAILRNQALEQLDTVGLILVPPAPPSQRTPGEVMEVALDFGSTNTTVYVKGQRETAPQRVALEGRRLDLLRTNAPPGRPLEFVPTDTRTMPISTVLVRRPHLKSEPRAAEEVGGGAGFVVDMRDINAAVVAKFSGGVAYDFNIKWLPAQLGLSRMFLRHLALLVLAEAAARGVDVENPSSLNWFVSYPSAYTPTHFTQFIRGMEHVLGYFLPPQARVPVNEETESVCAARYFRARGQGAPGGTTIVADIGGGTSDIAVWQHRSDTNRPLIWQSSVRFAGQQLVVEPIARNLVQAAGASATQNILQVLARMPGSRGTGQASFNEAVTLLAEHAREYQRGIDADWADWLNLVGIAINNDYFGQTVGAAFADLSADSRNAKVFDVVALGFAGLLWFIGRQLKAMTPPPDGKAQEPGKPDARLDPSYTKRIVICLAGRPSRILREIITNRFGYKEAFATILRSAAGFGPDTRLDIEYTEHPKEEVAIGLLTRNLWVQGDTDTLPVATILGEKLAGAEGAEADHMLPKDARALHLHESAPEMNAFLQCIRGVVVDRRAGTPFLDLPDLDRDLPELVNRANGAMAAVAGAAAAPQAGGDSDDSAPAGRALLTMEVQPPFFALLHQVIRRLQEQRA